MAKVLIVDDSRAVRAILRRIMTGIGFESIEAPNGKEGLETFEQISDEIELALIDWNMPEMDGLEMIERIRAQERFDNHKLMMVTTESEPARMAKALMAGVDEFVMKPFTAEIIEEKLKLLGVSREAKPATPVGESA